MDRVIKDKRLELRKKIENYQDEAIKYLDKKVETHSLDKVEIKEKLSYLFNEHIISLNIIENDKETSFSFKIGDVYSGVAFSYAVKNEKRN